jgi:hypothetical protein
MIYLLPLSAFPSHSSEALPKQQKSFPKCRLAPKSLLLTVFLLACRHFEQAEKERSVQKAELERRKQLSVTKPPVAISGVPADVGKQGFLFKRSSGKILGNYKWQKRFFFISGNALYYRNLTEDSGPSQFKSSNLLSGISGDKKIVFGSNTEVRLLFCCCLNQLLKYV